MICLGDRDGFPIISALIYCMGSQPWENIELMALTNGWDPKVVIYFLQIGSLLIKVGSNKYSQ